MPIDPKIEAVLRLRSNVAEANGLVVLLGYDARDFLEALSEETDVEMLRTVMIILPIQDVSNVKNGREKNDLAQKLVQSRIDKLLEERAT